MVGFLPGSSSWSCRRAVEGVRVARHLAMSRSEVAPFDLSNDYSSCLLVMAETKHRFSHFSHFALTGRVRLP